MILTCAEVIQKIPRFLEDTLSEHESLLFQQHVQTCERCRQGCLNARKSNQTKVRWLRITTVLNVLLVFCAIIYFAFGPVITAKIQAFLKAFENQKAPSLNAETTPLQKASRSKLQPFVHLKPLHWDMVFSDRSKLESLGAQLRADGIKVLYENPGVVILAVHYEEIDSLVSILAEAGGSLQGGGSIYSFKLPVFEGDFRVSINLKFPQSRVTQPLAHHWHLSFQLPNRFMAKDAIRATGARFLYEASEIWIVQIPGRGFNQMKETIRSIHGLEVDFGTEAASADSYGKIPVTISLYISEG